MGRRSLCLLPLLLLPAAAPAVPCVDYSGFAAATLDVRGVTAVRGVAAVGSTFYLARVSTFEVHDASDPAAPVLLGTVPIGGGARHVVIDGNLAFVPVWWRPFGATVSELKVLDVGNPASPQLVATVPLASGEAHDVAVADGYAYVACGSAGIVVVDVDPPGSSHVAATVAMPGEAWGIAILDDLLVVAAGSGGVRVHDRADPENPAWIATRPVVAPEIAIDVAPLDGADRIVASIRYDHWNHNYRKSRFAVLDLSSPASPAEVGTTASLEIGRAAHVTVSGDRAYAAVTDDSYRDAMLAIVDVSDPAAPSPVGFFAFPPDSAQGVAVLDDRVILGEGSQPAGAYQILDVSKPVAPVLATVDVGQSLSGSLALHEGRLYAGQSFVGLSIRDALDPALPVLGTIPDGSPEAMAFDDDVLWVGLDYEGFGSLKSFDVSDPADPVPLGSLATPTGVLGMERDGDLAFLAEAYDGYGYQESRLEIVDTSDPASPALVGFVDFGQGGPFARSLAVHAGYVHVPWGGSLVTYDVSDPANPTPAGTPLTMPWRVTWVERRGELLLATLAGDGDEALQVLSLADPAAPQRLGSTDLPSTPDRVHVVGDVAYVACPVSGLHVVSLEDPAEPRLVGGVSPGLRVWDVVAGADRIYLGAGRSGRNRVVTVPPACLASATAAPVVARPGGRGIAAVPNPFRPCTSVEFSIGRAGPVALSVYDVAGRRVAQLADRRMAAGSHRVVWDGRSEEGVEVAAGVYFLRLRTDEGTRTRTVQRLR